jgi:hypothetical protein
LVTLGLPGSSSSKALVSCMMLVPAWRKLWLRRDALAGDSKSRITSCASALSCLRRDLQPLVQEP